MNSKLSLEDNKKLLEPWLSVIGLLIVQWSPVERKIDECIVILSMSKNTKKKPNTLSHKLSYIQDNLSGNLSFIEDINILIRATKETVQVRDVCVHGVIESCDNERMIIGKVDGRSQDFKIEMFTFDQKRLYSANHNLIYLNETWDKLLQELYSALKTANKSVN